MMARVRSLSSGHPVAEVFLIGWAFVYMIEGASGFGTPVALAAPMLVSLGHPPVESITCCLITDTLATVYAPEPHTLAHPHAQACLVPHPPVAALGSAIHQCWQRPNTSMHAAMEPSGSRSGSASPASTRRWTRMTSARPASGRR